MDINARQLGALDFNFLDQSETYQYIADQLARVKGCQPMMNKLSVYVTSWEAAMQTFDVAYRKTTTTLQTKAVKTLDEERDDLYSGFTGTVNNAKKSPIAAQREAAEQIAEPIKRYDVDASGEYEQQTMRTEQLCNDLLTNFQSQLTALNLTAWVEALRAKNQEFQAAMNARTNDQADYVPSELTQLRRQMIAAYRNFVKMLNVVLLYEGDAEYATVVDQLNAEVRHYKQIIARKGGTTSATTNTGGTGSSTNTGGTNENGGTQQGGSTDNPSTGSGDTGSGTEQGGGTGTLTPTDPGTDNPSTGSGGDNGGSSDNGGDNGGGGGSGIGGDFN